ncbi:RM36 protein, partial [Piaya cayana]|nr:RM36 protein [Piaya cayana]NWH73834.1 RM36 protein [Piaya cayana]
MLSILARAAARPLSLLGCSSFSALAMWRAAAVLPVPVSRAPLLWGGVAVPLPTGLLSLPLVAGLKTKVSLKRRCKDCFIVRRRGRLYVYCKTNPRHKQRKL